MRGIAYREREREEREGGKRTRSKEQCACIARATRIDQSFANYARDFFLS